MTTNQNTPAAGSEVEIDLIAIIKSLWTGRKTLLKFLAVFSVLGLMIAITTPREFTATAVLVPSELNGSSELGGLGGLASMVGLDINAMTGTELSPIFYPRIAESYPFMLELMKTKLTFSDRKDSVTFLDYATEEKKSNPLVDYTIGLPSLILSIPFKLLAMIKGEPKEEVTGYQGDNGPRELTPKEKETIAELSQCISLSVDKKDGYLTLSAIMPEAKPAAQLGIRAQELLQQYVTDFKIKKAQANYNFILQRCNETRKNLELSQNKLAEFTDRNRNVSLATAKVEFEKLNRDYNLNYDLYSELAKQLEQANIKVKRDTPVFTVIDPIFVPTTKSSPNRPLILIIWILFGGIIGAGYLLGRGTWEKLVAKWSNS